MNNVGQKDLTDAERLDALRLIRSENVGPRTFFSLLSRYGDAGQALAALPSLSRAGGRKRALTVCSEDDALRELDQIDQIGATLVTIDEANYPPLLRRIPDPPPVLTVLGQAETLCARPAIAIVGARNASALGRKMAYQLATDLGQHGYVIVSGLARGIDGVAHRAGLATGTIAVVAGGIDVIYPPEHKDLTAEIGENGLLISEITMGMRPTRTHFPRRNRLVSGICAGTIIIDAAARSGSLITARTALEQNREVFAVPGSPLDPRAAGANGLIRDGAILVRHADDVLAALNPMVRTLADPPVDLFSLQAPDTPAFFHGDSGHGNSGHDNSDPGQGLRQRVRDLLSVTPIEIDELIRAADAPTRHIVGIVLELELAGQLVRQSGQRVALRP